VSIDATMTVDDPAQFVADPDVKEALRQSMASTSGVAKEWVSVELEVTSRRLQGAARQLSGQVAVSFSITIPESSASELPMVEQALSQVTTEGLKQSVNDHLTEMGRTDISVEVQDIGAADVQTVTGAPPTTSTIGFFIDKANGMHGMLATSMVCVWLALELTM